MACARKVFSVMLITIVSIANGCTVGQLKVERTLTPSDLKSYSLDEPHVKALIQGASPEFVDFRDHTWSCIDGRHTYPTLATPGGDISEAILGITALSKATGKNMTESRVQELLDAIVEALVSPSRPFYLHSDEHAEERIREELQASELDFVKPPSSIAASLLDALVTPDNIGCGHLKRTVKNVDNIYETPQVISVTAIRWFYSRLWNDSKGMFKYVAVPGDHLEGSLVVVASMGCPNQAAVYTPNAQPFNATAAIPLGKGQVFAFHANEAAFFRKQISTCLARREGLNSEETKVLARSIEAIMNDIFSRQVVSTAGALAAGRPQDLVTIEASSPKYFTPIPKPTFAPGSKYALYQASMQRSVEGNSSLPNVVSVQTALGLLMSNPGQLRVEDSTRHTWSCIDGRHRHQTLATPGGDFSEFLLALNALEQVSATLSNDQIEEMYMKYIALYIDASRPFYMHTDEEAVEKIREAVHMPELDLASPPAATRSALTTLVTDYAYQGLLLNQTEEVS
mmetsp:Transcript_15268/g.25180  ORF Transcript_15268/g.25180 Transcript_15268/m.25180 type:complete len:513 (+) Transcript_15268:233-1771(+)